MFTEQMYSTRLPAQQGKIRTALTVVATAFWSMTGIDLTMVFVAVAAAIRGVRA